MDDPRWLRRARTYKGLREIPGPQNNPTILKFWREIHAPFTDDETPWCAGFVGGVLEESGVRSSRSASARSYLNWGVRLSHPLVGCITVFSRGVNNGHVAFFLGFTPSGDIRVLGGNQHDSVCEAVMPRGRVLGYRWPSGEPVAQVLPQPKPMVDAPREAGLGDIPVAYAPDEAPIAPVMATSKTGNLSVGVGLAGAAEALQQGNEIAGQVGMAKDNAESLGVTTWWGILLGHPGLLIGLVVVAAAGFIWWDHRRYKLALSEAQAAPK